MQPFTIAPLTPADGPAVAQNNISAFWQIPNWRLMWTPKNKTMDYVISQGALRLPQVLLQETERRRHQKAIDMDGKLVGYIRWHLPSGTENAGELWREAKVNETAVSGEERIKFKRDFDSADWEWDTATDVLDRHQIAMKAKLMEGKNYLTLEYLAVAPEHQGQGIASMLVESGLKEIENLGFDCFVMACKPGLNLYLRAGFVLLDQLIQDDSICGGPGEFAMYFLEKTFAKK